MQMDFGVYLVYVFGLLKAGYLLFILFTSWWCLNNAFLILTIDLLLILTWISRYKSKQVMEL